MTLDTRERVAIAAVLLTAALAALVRSQPQSPLEWLDWALWDTAQTLLAEAPPEPGVTIVLVDDESLVRLEERWPLDRARWGEFLQTVATYKPAVVGLDAWFETPAPSDQLDLAEEVMDRLAFGTMGASPEGAMLTRWLDDVLVERDADRTFSTAMARAGRVVLGVACPIRDRDALQFEKTLTSPFPFAAGERPLAQFCPNPTGNLPSLAIASSGEAGLYVVPDLDGVIRRYTFAFGTSQGPVPMLGTALALAANLDQREVLTERATAWAQSPPLLRYRASHTFKTVRFSDVLETGAGSEPLRAAFEGRAVLVGVSALGVEDLRTTATEQDIPGVFVHANAFAGLLQDDVLRTDPKSTASSRYWAFLVLAVLALVGMRMPNARSVMALMAGLLAGYGVVAWQQLGAGVAFPLAIPPLAVLAWGVTRLSFEYLRNQDARQQAAAVRDAFKFYLAPAVVEQLVEDPTLLKLGGERRVITAFFSDVAGFTTISETLDPQELSELLNECLGGMTEVLLEEGGTIDKYIGDAIVAMFGAPLDQPDHADRALRAAVRCQERLEELRPRWRERGWPEVVVRIGLNSGPATVGNMGSAQRFDYTMLGDTVNLAARLEGANKAFGTLNLVGDKTAALSSGETPLVEIDLVQVKGKTEGVRVFTPEPSAERRAALTDALAKYRAQDWAAAKSAYAAIGGETGSIFCDRIDVLSKDPPGGDWDGVYRLTTK